MYKSGFSGANLSHDLCPIVSRQRGREFRLDPWWLGVLPAGVSVLLLCSRSCVPFPDLPGLVSALTPSPARASPSSFPLIGTGPQDPSCPFALAALGTPFLQGLLYFPLSSLPLQIPTVTRRPRLIPLSAVLRPRTRLTCFTSLFSQFHFPILAVTTHQGLHYVLGSQNERKKQNPAFEELTAWLGER